MVGTVQCRATLGSGLYMIATFARRSFDSRAQLSGPSLGGICARHLLFDKVVLKHLAMCKDLMLIQRIPSSDYPIRITTL